MTRQSISRGTSANAGDGDTLRDAAQKINQNFVELYQKLGGDSDVLSTNVSFTSTGIVFEGANADSFETVFAITEPTKDNTITFPDSTGEVIISVGDQDLYNKHLYNTKIDGVLRLHGVSGTGYYKIAYEGQVDSDTDLNVNFPALADSDTIVFANHAATLTNKTLTSPTLNGPVITSGINDANGAEMIRFTATASAINDISITNAATGGSPKIAAVGDNTNINLDLAAKGTGAIRHTRKVAYSSETKTSSGAVSLLVPLTLFNSTGALAMTLANGTVVGESKKFVNINTGAATVTPTSFGQGTSFTLSQNGAAEAIWTGSNWHLFGDSDNFLTIT